MPSRAILLTTPAAVLLLCHGCPSHRTGPAGRGFPRVASAGWDFCASWRIRNDGTISSVSLVTTATAFVRFASGRNAHRARSMGASTPQALLSKRRRRTLVITPKHPSYRRRQDSAGCSNPLTKKCRPGAGWGENAFGLAIRPSPDR